MNTPKKRWYQTFMEILALPRRRGGKEQWPKEAPKPALSIAQVIEHAESLPAADAKLSDRELALCKDENPTLGAIMHHAYAGMENLLAQAFDPDRKPEARLSALDRAAGIKLFIEDVQVTRAALQKVIRERELREVKKQK